MLVLFYRANTKSVLLQTSIMSHTTLLPFLSSTILETVLSLYAFFMRRSKRNSFNGFFFQKIVELYM